MRQLHPTVFDIARIERILISIDSKIGTLESIMMRNDEEMREDRHEDEMNGHYEESLA